ncbi:MAG: PAS domain S-box protein [Gammaproteobacteria bacterium]|nr:PAS domain S-box protein [Gammaproteobacteria bacterium]
MTTTLSSNMLEVLLDHLDDAVITADQRGCIVQVNSTTERIFGYRPDELIGQNLRMLMPEPHATQHDHYIQNYLAGGLPKIIGHKRQVKGTRKDGSLVDLLLKVDKISIKGVPHFIGMLRDLTESIAQQQALQHATLLNQQVLEHAAHAVIATDVDGIISMFNPAAERLLGYGAGELIGRLTPARFHDPQEVVRRAAEFSRELGLPLEPGFEVFVAKSRLGLANEHEWTYIRKDGRPVPVLLSVSAIHNERGEISGFLGNAVDISERKQHEHKLAESERRFRGAFATSTNGVAIVALDGKWLQVNRALCTMLGFSEKALLATDFQAVTHPDDLRADLAEVASLLAGERDNYQIEKRYIASDGRIVWALLGVSLVRDGSGAPLYFVSQVVDISDRKRAEAELKFSTDLLAAVSRLQQIFIESQDRQQTFDRMLQDLLSLTVSGYGFVGEVLHNDDGNPYLNTYAITNVAWNDETRQFYAGQAPKGLEFRNLHSLFGHTMRTGSTVISNDPTQDPRAGGLPPGHPAMNCYLGLPLLHAGVMVGMVGVANRPGGYDQLLADKLQPLLTAAAQIIVNLRMSADQQRASDQLALAEQRWQFALEGSGDGIWDWDAVTNSVFFSRRWKAMLGYADDEVGTSLEEWSSRVHPDDLAACMADLQRHFSGQAPLYVNEHRVRHKDGRWLWILDRGMVVAWQADGQPARVIGTHSDVTERRAIEERIRLHEERWNFALEGSGDGVWDWNMTSGEVFYSRRWKAMLGYRDDEIGDTLDEWTSRVHPDDLPRALALVERHTHGEIPNFALEIRMRHKNGQWLWILDRGKIVSGSAPGQPNRIIGTHTDISARKAAEAGLRERDELLRKLSQQVPGVIFQYQLRPDGSSCFPWASDGLWGIYGVTPAQVADDASTVYGVIDPGDISQVIASVQRSAQQLSSWRCEYRVNHPSRGQIWVEGYSTPQQQADGSILWHGYITDISERKQAELALNQSRKRLKELLDHLPLNVLYKDSDGYYLAANPAYAQLLGLTAEQLVGRCDRDFFTAELTAKYRADDLRVMALGVTESFDEAFNHAGDNQIVHTIKVPVRDDDDHINGVLILFWDVTAEREATTALMRSQARLRALTDKVPLVVFELERDASGSYQFNFINSGVDSLFGLPLSAAEDDVSLLFGKVERDDAQRLMQALEASADNLTTIEQEIRLNGDGEPRWVAVQAVPQRQGVMTVVWYGFFQEISIRKSTEAELRRAKVLAEDANRAKSQFLANISHEIRTPMNAVLGLTYLLQQGALNGQQRDYVDKIDSAGRTLLALLNDVLDLAKIDAGRLTLEHAPFDLHQLLDNLAVIAAGSARSHELELCFRIDPQLPQMLVGDAMRLQQVLINLLGNAIKFSPSGSVELLLQVNQRNAVQVELTFTVRDTGIGIAPEQLAQIFDSFSQAEASTTRRFGGSGLGLAISRQLVRLMGGDIEVHSSLGVGSEFSFSLPLAISSDECQPAAGDWAGKRLLVVDDNPISLQAMAELAALLGAEVCASDNAVDALALAITADQQQRPFNALLVDWQMPQMDGLSLIAALQPQLQHQPTRVVMVTAHGRELLGSHLAQQVDSILTKPVTLNQLRASLQPKTPTAPIEQRPQRLGSRHLLLVEDNPLNQQVAAEMLRLEGASVEIATNGLLAIDALRHQPERFDLVLMDLQMPELDGIEATRQIRHQLGLTTLPIVAMTANAMTSDRDHCLAAGMNDHIGKPVNVEELVGVICRLTAGTGPTGRLLRPSAQPAHFALLDRGAALDRMGSNDALYQRLLQQFVQQYGRLPPAASLWQQPADERLRLFHSIKGVAATIGAEQLAAAAASLEHRARSDDPPTVAELVTMDDTLVATIAAINSGSEAPATAPANNAPAAPLRLTPSQQQVMTRLLKALQLGDLGAGRLLAEIDNDEPTLIAFVAQLKDEIDGCDYAAAIARIELLLASDRPPQEYPDA